ncbi:6-phospho-beta-glucosidase [Streptomyces malaysiensis subsp. malaysiensis]|uniref:6-phospho-beta-glucosidase n=2 Tax=Streptomyces TaxID=1883 RepID=A0ABX6W3M9_STRMQ|nr:MULTISPECIES: 6-phospho-beta-glucosidase [Streptomyces]AQA11673.1 6-phospho-beta-glucosidase [Streptomyces autolyticus]QPI56099.1 6-phospho-beta-glucosidase [Streptomyces solisilvae]UHH17570.1 6-phospho-beta-glucosidase [Streptomyces sp. HNM0561]
MKLTVLGGGGFRVPYVYQALLSDQGSPRIDDVWLYDTDPARLKAMAEVLARFADGHADAPRVTVTTSLDDALEGSDFVFAAIRVGGLEGRVCDERVALDLDVLGQETTGPGGLAYGLRTIPVMLDIAHRVRRLAPHAYVINFTNPAGMITEAMQTVLGDRVLGICDTPSGLGRRIATTLGLDPSRAQFDYVGLNHLGWMRRVLHDGEDILPRLLADERLGDLEEGVVFGREWLRDLGVIPNEYLYYYYFNREAVRSILDAPQTRGEFLARQQQEFYQRVTEAAGGSAVSLWRKTIADRSANYMAEAKGAVQGEARAEEDFRPDPAHQGYAGVALSVMAAISRNERATMILNVRNGTTVSALPGDAVVEVPVTVDANGVHPLTITQPDLSQAGLMQQVKAVERLTISAATTGSRADAVKAFSLHPLVDSVTVGRKLLDGYIDRIPEVAAVFGGHTS